MKKIYKRIKVNKEILQLNVSVKRANPNQFMQSEVSDTIPTGKVIGVYFIPYIELSSPVFSGGENQATRGLPFRMSQTDITIKDSRGRPLTEPTDIKDYQHKGGGYNEGFKELDFESQNERVTIAWETIGSRPICGEFIFEIEAPEKC